MERQPSVDESFLDAMLRDVDGDLNVNVEVAEGVSMLAETVSFIGSIETLSASRGFDTPLPHALPLMRSGSIPDPVLSGGAGLATPLDFDFGGSRGRETAFLGGLLGLGTPAVEGGGEGGIGGGGAGAPSTGAAKTAKTAKQGAGSRKPRKKQAKCLSRKPASERAARTSMYRGVTRASKLSWGAKYSSKRICNMCKTEAEAARKYDEYMRVNLPKKYLKFANFCPTCDKFRNTLQLEGVASDCLCTPLNGRRKRNRAKAKPATTPATKPAARTNAAGTNAADGGTPFAALVASAAASKASAAFATAVAPSTAASQGSASATGDAGRGRFTFQRAGAADAGRSGGGGSSGGGGDGDDGGGGLSPMSDQYVGSSPEAESIGDSPPHDEEVRCVYVYSTQYSSDSRILVHCTLSMSEELRRRGTVNCVL